MAEAALNLADWILLDDVGEAVRRRNGYHDGLARGDVLAALEAGCGLMLRWVGDDGREVCREFPKRDSWEDILVWAGLPRRLCIQLPPNERKGSLPYPYAYLLRTDAVRLGLLPASELPQAKQQSEPQRPPEKRALASVDVQPQPQPQPQPPAPKLSGKEWVLVAYERRPNELRAMTITDAAHALAEESKTASDCAKSLGKGYCTNLLRELNVWPKKPRNSPKQGPK